MFLKKIQQRHIRHCQMADPAYGEGVAKALGKKPAFKCESGYQVMHERSAALSGQYRGDI